MYEVYEVYEVYKVYESSTDLILLYFHNFSLLLY